MERIWHKDERSPGTDIQLPGKIRKKGETNTWIYICILLFHSFRASQCRPLLHFLFLWFLISTLILISRHPFRMIFIQFISLPSFHCYLMLVMVLAGMPFHYMVIISNWSDSVLKCMMHYITLYIRRKKLK